MTTIHDLISTATASYANEMSRLIGEENFSVAQLEIARELAVERHEVERDQIITWANDLCADRIIATRKQFDDLIARGNDRVGRLELVRDSISNAEVLKSPDVANDITIKDCKFIKSDEGGITFIQAKTLSIDDLSRSGASNVNDQPDDIRVEDDSNL